VPHDFVSRLVGYRLRSITVLFLVAIDVLASVRLNVCFRLRADLLFVAAAAEARAFGCERFPVIVCISTVGYGKLILMGLVSYEATRYQHVLY
jgi:hypothetical protein